MSAKKYLVVAIGLNAALLAFAAFHMSPTGKTQRTNGSSEFGPVIETVLPPARGDSSVDILDLETGRTMLQPPFEYFNGRAPAIMGWIRSNSLDISCFTWSSGAACVTYDMTLVPVEGHCWDTAREQELVHSPALAPALHSPRRLLVLGHGRPDTFLFRTGDGTLGILRLVGADQKGKGVKIRFKLVNEPRGSSPALSQS